MHFNSLLKFPKDIRVRLKHEMSRLAKMALGYVSLNRAHISLEYHCLIVKVG